MCFNTTPPPGAHGDPPPRPRPRGGPPLGGRHGARPAPDGAMVKAGSAAGCWGGGAPAASEAAARTTATRPRPPVGRPHLHVRVGRGAPGAGVRRRRHRRPGGEGQVEGVGGGGVRRGGGATKAPPHWRQPGGDDRPGEAVEVGVRAAGRWPPASVAQPPVDAP
eukprot:TRINITY_DN1276_c0_g2_i1.p4 TRINITY_DN1276_c0_g2~~TRINITY_DN1276_c0_g2_i1.p4  ORF type:complete len:164 (-),score=17.22 TRINITY_DN1276_c0_g2_i1:207-698(-)